MNLRDLSYILAVGKFHHFGRAADYCNVSQPTLSAQIRKLEEHLGVTIFERSNRHVIPTSVGEDMIACAENILQEVRYMEALARQSNDPLAGDFAFGAFPTLASYIFPKITSDIKKALPNVRLILREEKTDALLEQLHEGILDAALLATPIDDDHLLVKPLFEDVFYVAIPPSHTLSHQHRITQAMLKDEEILLLEEGHCLRDQALELCHLPMVSNQQDVTGTSLETVREMVKAGTGITIMPEIAMRKERGILYKRFADPAPSRTIALVYRKTALRTALLDKIAGIIRSHFPR